jgi:hypothetical protein
MTEKEDLKSRVVPMAVRILEKMVFERWGLSRQLKTRTVEEERYIVQDISNILNDVQSNLLREWISRDGSMKYGSKDESRPLQGSKSKYGAT